MGSSDKMRNHTATWGWRTLKEERVCTECAWEARVAERSAEGPHGTKAASSEASASLGALVGTDASLRAASVTLMYLRGQPSRLCLLQDTGNASQRPPIAGQQAEYTTPLQVLASGSFPVHTATTPVLMETVWLVVGSKRGFAASQWN